MKQYLLSIYQPDGPPPPDLDLTAIMRDVHALSDDMKTRRRVGVLGRTARRKHGHGRTGQGRRRR